MTEWPNRVRQCAARAYEVRIGEDTYEISIRLSSPRRHGSFGSRVLVFLDDPLRGSRGVWVHGADSLQALKLAMNVVDAETQRLHCIKGGSVYLWNERSSPRI